MILIASLVAVTTVISTLATTVCGPPLILSVPLTFTVTTLCLEQQVVPSACMEALMQHYMYQAAGFSKEVSRLAAAPRRTSANRMYNKCMTTGGYASLTGPKGMDLIRLVPQLLR